MKKILISLVIGLLIGALAVFFILKETTPQKIESAEKNSFYEVSSKLNLGGNLYFYVSTEKVIQTVEEFAGKIRKILESQAAKIQSEKMNPLAVFDLVFQMIQNCGLMEISGIGMSSIAIGKNLNHTTFVLHHYPDKGKGLIWNLMESAPHEMTEIKLLPANTVMAGFADVKLKTLWQWIKKEVEASNLPELKKGILSAEPMLKAQGIELEQLLDSLSGRMGMVMALDAENTSRIPLGQIPVDLPNPDMALIFSAENSYLFDLLQKMMPFAQKSEEKDVKKLIIPLPPTLPIPLKPVIWQKDNLLFIASNEDFVKSILSARKKGDGLIKTEEFKALSLHMPKKGNSFRFISARLVDLFLDIQQKAMQASAMGKEEDKIAREIFDLFPKNLALYGITRNSDEGLVFTVNTNLSFEYIALLPATAAVGIAAAVAIPNLLTAKQKGGQKATMSDLKMISMAIETYRIDKGYPPQGNTLGEIRAQLEPFYIKKLPLKDAWGNDFLYRYISQDGKHVYYIGSGGRDGVFEDFEQSGFYMVTGVNDFNKDIIIKNGEFILGPQVK